MNKRSTKLMGIGFNGLVMNADSLLKLDRLPRPFLLLERTLMPYQVEEIKHPRQVSKFPERD